MSGLHPEVHSEDGEESINAKTINYKQTLSNSKTQYTSRKLFARQQYHWSFSGTRYCKGRPEGQVTVAYILQMGTLQGLVMEDSGLGL